MDLKRKEKQNGSKFVNFCSIYNSPKAQLSEQMKKQKRIWIRIVEDKFRS